MQCCCHAVGRVNKVGEDYLGLLVLGVFNASVGAKDIRHTFKRDAMVGDMHYVCVHLVLQSCARVATVCLHAQLIMLILLVSM